MPPLYAVGLMSGTSIDALDAALISYTEGRCRSVAALSRPWPADLRQRLHQLCESGPDEVERTGDLGLLYAQQAATLIAELLREAGLSPAEIAVIGSHGQTIRHRPARHFSWQLDNGPKLAALCGIDTVVDFRSADLARGGEGAPLTPLFHQAVFQKPGTTRMVLNLGGIANLTVLTGEGKIGAGFDCGPANTLLDVSCRTLLDRAYDEDGRLARQGEVVESWLSDLMSHPFLKQPPPKSTGREDFNAKLIAPLLKTCAKRRDLIPSLLRTLTEFTVQSAVDCILQYQKDGTGDLILCGGGALNPLMRELFEKKLQPCGYRVLRAEDCGVSSEFLEAEAFAFFALSFILGKPLDLREVTGSQEPCILGCLCPATGGYYQQQQQKLGRLSCS